MFRVDQLIPGAYHFDPQRLRYTMTEERVKQYYRMLYDFENADMWSNEEKKRQIEALNRKVDPDMYAMLIGMQKPQ